jgi:HK97 family phage major capsid protein
MDEKELKALMDGIAEKNGHAIREAVKTEVLNATAGLLKSDQLAGILEAQGIKADTIKTLVDAVEKQGMELRKVFEGKPAIRKTIEEIVQEKAKEIVQIAKGGPNVKLNVNKALVTRAAVTNTTMAMRLNEIGQIATLGTVISDLFRHAQVSPSSNGVIRYYDQLTRVNNAASVAEGAVKPESAITWIERTLLIEKVADSIPVTKEAWNDVFFIQSEIRRLLEVNLALKVDDLLYDGDGITPNIKGVYTSAPLFVTLPYADTVEAANIYDLIATVATDISNNRQNKYQANTVLLNPVDTLRMKLLKDSQGRYVLPPFSGATNGAAQNVAGMQIVESSQVAPNTMVVGDFRFGTIYDLEDVTVEMGWINDQFIKNVFTILAEQRLALLIRTVDETAFRKVANITTALADLETP